MKRNQELRSTASLRRKTQLRRRNLERSKREFERAYGSQHRVQVINRMPCAGCGKKPTLHQPSHNAHIEGGGMGRKASWRMVVPLCARCHYLRDAELGSTALFNARMRVNLYDVARELALNHPADGVQNKADLGF